jgi:hypothetical protein
MMMVASWDATSLRNTLQTIGWPQEVIHSVARAQLGHTVYIPIVVVQLAVRVDARHHQAKDPLIATVCDQGQHLARSGMYRASAGGLDE